MRLAAGHPECNEGALFHPNWPLRRGAAFFVRAQKNAPAKTGAPSAYLRVEPYESGVAGPQVLSFPSLRNRDGNGRVGTRVVCISRVAGFNLACPWLAAAAAAAATRNACGQQNKR